MHAAMRGRTAAVVHAAHRAQVCEYIKLICKTFWSATYMGMPEQFSQQNMFLQWMSALGNALTKPQPPVRP